MTVKQFIKDRWYLFFAFFVMVLLLLCMFFAFKIPFDFIFAIFFVIFLFFFGICSYDFYKRKTFYNDFLWKLQSLDQKYLITEMLQKPNFYDGKFLCDVLYEIDRSMNEKLKEFEYNLIDFKEFVEMWIHEVKIPLSSIMLMVHNHKGVMDQKLLDQVRRLEDYVDQVLYYVRSENSEKDYLIKECNLKKMVTNVALKNKDSLLYHQIELQTENLNYQVLTDSKWLEFIIGQIINNSLKYQDKEDGRIKISAEETENEVILKIYDNGKGIIDSDLPRVFEKSFTGENGRVGSTSTGMGLYICFNLCKKLGHGITIHSKKGEYTEVDIIFKRDHFYEVLK